MRTATDLREALRRVAARTAAYPWKVWGFGEAIGMLGLLAATAATGDERYRDVVEALFARWWRSAHAGLTFADHVAPGVPLVLLARRAPQWQDAAGALGDLYRRFPSIGGVPVHRPDLDGWSAHVWVDCLYTDGPFLALLGRVTGERSWEDLACAHTLAYVNVLRDDATGLFVHGYDAGAARSNAIRWGRGNGWALLGLLDLLRFLRDDHPQRPNLAGVARREAEALLALQDRSGHWHTVLDHPETYLEPSIAAMMAWALPQTIGLGVAGGAAAAAATRALDAALAATDGTGALTGVSEATPAGDLAAYATRPTGVFPWGQGPLLLALADRIAPGAVWEGVACE